MIEKVNKTMFQKLGFTLMEMLVIISMLAVLSAILVPNMVGFLSEAKNQTLKDNSQTTYAVTKTALKKAYVNKESLASTMSAHELAAYMRTLPLGNKIKIMQSKGTVEAVVWTDGGGHSATYYVATGSYTIT